MNDGFESRVEMPDFEGFRQPVGVPADLALRYSIDAKYGGGEQMRKDAASMKRIAAGLEKTVQGFRNLPPHQKEILSSAAREMRGLAATLTRLASWADGYKAFSDQRRQDEETAKAEAFAARRWGDDEHAHELDAAVLCELTGSGREDFVTWMQAQGLHQGVRATGVHFEADGSFHSAQLHKTGPTLRLRTAKFLMDMGPREWATDGELMTLGRNLLDRYIKYRRAIATLTKSIVEKAST